MRKLADAALLLTSLLATAVILICAWLIGECLAVIVEHGG
jgi:hypothetical protein